MSRRPGKERERPAAADTDRRTQQGREAVEHGERSPEPRQEDIARRAHELYLQRGGEAGKDIEDWLRAEAELRGRG